MSDPSPRDTEFQNRLSEVLDILPASITSKEAAKNYIEKIADLVEFIEGNSFYKGLIDNLYKNGQLLDADKEIKASAEQLMTQLKRMVRKANRFIAARSIKLPSWEEVIKEHVNQGVYSPTIAESLGSDMDRLNQLLEKQTISIDEIKDRVGDMRHTKFDFETLENAHPYSDSDLEKLEQLKIDFDQKKHLLEEQQRAIGISDYSVLKGVWEWQKHKPLSYNQIEITSGPMAAMLQSTRFEDSWYNIGDVVRDAELYQQRVKSVAHRLQESSIRKSYVLWKRLGRRVPRAVGWIIDRFNPTKLP